MNIYTQNPILIGLAALGFGFGWGALCERYRTRALFRLICLFCSFAAIGAIVYYTVLGRHPSPDRIFYFFARYNDEFWRELFMNALLYFPLGLAAAALLDGWTVLFAFALSFAIETWQFCSGAGVAQGSDVLMNTLGAVIGTLFSLPFDRILSKDSAGR